MIKIPQETQRLLLDIENKKPPPKKNPTPKTRGSSTATSTTKPTDGADPASAPSGPKVGSKFKNIQPQETMTLLLEHGPNPDIQGGYWDGTPPGPKRKTIEVPDLESGRKAYRTWIGENGLGGGNMTRASGTIKNGETVIGRFSYNGRLWDKDDKEILVPTQTAQTEVEAAFA